MTPNGGPSAEEIGAALAALLASKELGGSARLRRFLSFVVEKSLVGEASDLKEYTIALAVFDRESSFNPATNTIVRVEARRLRQLLAAYYHGSGREQPVVIELPKGSYIPAFHRRVPEAAAPAQDAGASPPEAPAGPTLARRIAVPALVAAVAALAAAGFIAVRSGILPGARVPHVWQLDGSTLRIFDQHGRLCWEKHFGAFDPSFPAAVSEKVLIADVDGDGRQEVLFNLLADAGGAVAGSLLCFEQNGSLRWQHRYGRPRTFAGRRFDADYRGRLVRRVTAGGKPRILTVANHYLWYPSQVALLDPATGNVVDEYWHPGAIYFGALYDVDRDGAEEFVFAAINNPGSGLGHPAAGILKLPFSRAPRRDFAPGDPFQPVTGGGELSYALLATPDLNRATGVLPIPTNFKVDSHGIALETPLPESGGISYLLGFDLKTLEYRFSDNFTALHNRFFLQRLVDHRLSEAETEALGRVALFTAAPDGNSAAVDRLWKH